MPIVIESTTTALLTSAWNGSAFEYNLSVTVPSGATTLCVGLAGTSGSISSIRFNGVDLVSRCYLLDGNTREIRIRDLDNPSVGTFNLQVLSTAQRTHRVVARVLSGVDTNTPRGTPVTAAGTSVAVSTAAGDLVLDMVSSTTALTAVGAGQTAQVNNVDDYYGASSELATGASTTMSWTAAAGFSGIAAVPYKEATGGGGAVRRRRVTLRAPKNTQRAFKPMSRLLMGATQIVGALPAPPGLEPIGGDATIDITRIKRHRTAMKGGR